MRVFVTGAGFSAEAKYPVTSQLFKQVDKFIQDSAPNRDGFSWRTDWPQFKKWLQKANTFLVREAGRQGNIENILTVMDLYLTLKEGMLLAWSKDSVGNPRWTAQKRYFRKRQMLDDIQRNRTLLSSGLVQYFEFRHQEDRNLGVSRREPLRRFSDRMLRPRDAVVTFNYDSSLERTLWEAGKWRPEDGYGFPINLRSTGGPTNESRGQPSQIQVLKLHGSVGWYAIDKMRVFLSPTFLQDMGINLADKHLPNGAWRSQGFPAVIEPSLVKRFDNQVVLSLWEKAARCLNKAEEVWILGYSLPEADSATMALLATTCRGKKDKIKVVNRNATALNRYKGLLPGCTLIQKRIADWIGE